MCRNHRKKCCLITTRLIWKVKINSPKINLLHFIRQFLNKNPTLCTCMYFKKDCHQINKNHNFCDPLTQRTNHKRKESKDNQEKLTLCKVLLFIIWPHSSQMNHILLSDRYNFMKYVQEILVPLPPATWSIARITT